MSITAQAGWNGPGSHDGTLSTVRPQDNALHLATSRWAFEHWYFDAHLDSGHTVIAFLQKRRPEEPPGSKPVVELLVYHPDGRRQQVQVRHHANEFAASASGADVTIGRSRCSSDYSGELPVHHVYAEAEDLVFDLAFHNELPSWMPGNGTTRYGAEDLFGWVVPAPRARVEGEVVIDGVRRRVTGRGYHDHNWGVGNMPRIIDRWHWGRLYTEDFSLLYAMVRTQKRYAHHESRPLMLGRDGRILLSTGEVELTEGPSSFHAEARRSHPDWLRLRVEDAKGVDGSVSVDLRLEVRRVIHGHDLLDDVPVVRSRAVKPVVRRLVGRPGYFRFESEFQLVVDQGGRVETRNGTTLHELVALH